MKNLESRERNPELLYLSLKFGSRRQTSLSGRTVLGSIDKKESTLREWKTS